MELFHGSYIAVEHPKIIKGRFTKDFGEGFYCTALKKQAKRGIILSQEQTYKETLSQMAPRQKMLLQAIAREKEARNITSQEFISRHSLPSASSVQSAAKGLLSLDMITKDDNVYRIYDYFFSEWLAKVY